MSVFNEIKNAVWGEVAPGSGERVNIETALGSRPGAADLDWQSSINDLLTVAGVEPSQENREALASELNFKETLDGSTKMNNKLHRTTLIELAKDGVAIPHPWMI